MQGNALVRIASHMDKSKQVLSMKTFILSYFDYCPFIFNRIYERATRIAHDNNESILIKNKAITSHKKNLQYLAIEIYNKTFNGLKPPFMDEIFLSPFYLKSSQFKTAAPHYKI